MKQKFSVPVAIRTPEREVRGVPRESIHCEDFDFTGVER
jgi:hypothetical protein